MGSTRVVMKSRRDIAFIFDMDGLLIDSEPLYQRSRSLAAAELGYRLTADYYYRCLAGRHLNDCTDLVLGDFGADFPFTRFVELCMQHVSALSQSEGFPVKPGAANVVENLAGLAPCAVASGSRREHVDRCLVRAKLKHHFEHIVTREDATRGKPSPDLFLAAAAKLGVKPDHCVAFEDSNDGVLAAGRAGMRVLMVPDVQGVSDESRSIASALVGDLNEALAFVRATFL